YRFATELHRFDLVPHSQPWELRHRREPQPSSTASWGLSEGTMQGPSCMSDVLGDAWQAPGNLGDMARMAANGASDPIVGKHSKGLLPFCGFLVAFLYTVAKTTDFEGFLQTRACMKLPLPVIVE